MPDRAVPNLPSRDFDVTERFYGSFGFERRYRSEAWLILAHGGIELEFFPYPDLDPTQSSFRCSVRVTDLDGLVSAILVMGVPRSSTGIPRLTPVAAQPWGARVAYLIDPDGTQLALIGE